jgi:hypothetical protein
MTIASFTATSLSPPPTEIHTPTPSESMIESETGAVRPGKSPAAMAALKKRVVRGNPLKRKKKPQNNKFKQMYGGKMPIRKVKSGRSKSAIPSLIVSN